MPQGLSQAYFLSLIHIWWIEHPEERQAMERRYAEHARQYSLEESIRQTEEMFRQAIAEQRGAKA